MVGDSKWHRVAYRTSSGDRAGKNMGGVRMGCQEPPDLTSRTQRSDNLKRLQAHAERELPN